MTRRLLLLTGLAVLARADSAVDAREAVKRLADALGNGEASAAVSTLDPSMPGYAELRAALENLLRHADAQSTIEIPGNTGDDHSRTLKLNWHLRLEEREGSPASTERQAEVTCRLAMLDGQWRIVAFEPASLFALPRGAEAWNVVQSAASALSEGNAAGFLAFFDHAMEGYETLRAQATALAETSEVESSVELVSNDGSDLSRGLTVDWTLEMTNPDTGIRAAERHEQVKCRLELRGQHWRITRLEPLEFFRPPG